MTRTANGTPLPLPDDVLTPDGGIVTIRPARADDQASCTPQSPLRRVLAPRAVAVVGADRCHGGAGHEALRALRDYGFRGRLYAVNQSGRPVCGVPAYRAVADLPRPVDLLVIAVAADQVARVLTDAGPLGVHGAVLLGTGLHGTDLVAERGRREILRVARENGIRLLGPACLGILNTDPAVRLNATLAPARPPNGGLALAVRSGAMGIALLADAVREHCGVSTLVSLGDETDITGSDLLAHWLDDPATRAIALSPEAFADPGRFARAARALGRRKPVLAITSAQLHAPGEDLLAGTGVIRTASVGETIDTARMLVDQPLPAGNRMGLVGNAGGLTALAADTARGYGFDVMPLGGPARTGAGRDANPVDLGCDALPARIADAAETVASSGEADLLLLILVGTRVTVLAATLSALGPVLDDYPSLPVAAVVTGGAGEFHQLGRRGAPIFREPAQAVQALAHARDYAAWRRDPLARRPEPVGLHAGTERASIRRALSARPGRTGRKLTADVLAAYGIEMLPAAPAGIRPSRFGRPPWPPPGPNRAAT
jgi:acyl-CoA synthetase (NDP forming)